MSPMIMPDIRPASGRFDAAFALPRLVLIHSDDTERARLRLLLQDDWIVNTSRRANVGHADLILVKLGRDTPVAELVRSGAPVVLLADAADEPACLAGLEAGAQDFLLAPFSDGQLLARLRRRVQTSGRVDCGEEQLQRFIDHAPVSIAMFDREMRYIAASRRWIDLVAFGGDIIGHSHYELHPNMPPHWREAHRRALAGETVAAAAESWRRQDGCLRWTRWEVQPWRSNDGVIGGVAIFVDDITDRQNALEAARRSEEFARDVLDALPQEVAVLDASGSIIEVNEPWERMARENDASPQQVGPGANYFAVCEAASETGDADAKAALQALRAVLSGERDMCQMEYPCHPPGGMRWFLMQARRFNRGGLVLSHSDITQRKLAEYKLTTTLDSITDGFVACDADWRYIYVNAAAERITGIPRKTLLGAILWEIFPETVGTTVEDEYRRAAMGEIRDFENFYPPLDSWFHNRVFPCDDGGVTVYFEDITARKREQKQLEESESRYRELAQNANSAIIRWSRDGRIAFFNAYAQTYFGYGGDTAIGQNIRILFPNAGEGLAIDDLLTGAKGAGQAFTQNVRYDGLIVWMNWTHREIRDDNGEVAEILSIGNDVTERVQVEEALRHERGLLESVMQATDVQLVLLDAAFNFLWVNAAYAETCKLSPAEMVGKNHFELYPDAENYAIFETSGRVASACS